MQGLVQCKEKAVHSSFLMLLILCKLYLISASVHPGDLAILNQCSIFGNSTVSILPQHLLADLCPGSAWPPQNHHNKITRVSSGSEDA